MPEEEWEYRYQIVHIEDLHPDTGTSDTLNKLGEKGWEAVSLVSDVGSIGGYTVLVKHRVLKASWKNS